MKSQLGLGLAVMFLGLYSTAGQAEDKKTAVVPKTQITPKSEYSMVELAPGKMVKKLNTAPAGTPGRVGGSPVADAIVGTYDSGHNYSEKTPPASSGDKKPQVGINPGAINEKYQDKGKVLTPAAPQKQVGH